MKPLHLLAGALAASALAASGAQAGLVKVTFAGTVTSGSDLTGLFGPANGDLSGLAFTATYLFDDAFGGVTLNPPVSSGFDSGVLNSDPRVVLTIGGRRLVSDCAFFAVDVCTVGLLQRDAPGDWRVAASHSGFAVDTSPPTGPETWTHGLSLSVASAVNDFLPSYDYHTPYLHVLGPGDVGQGGLSLVNTRDIGEPTEHLGYFVQADLAPTSVSVSVPEPAAWVVMILGFGLAGAALRGRRAGACPAT